MFTTHCDRCLFSFKVLCPQVFLIYQRQLLFYLLIILFQLYCSFLLCFRSVNWALDDKHRPFSLAEMLAFDREGK